jgi:hypothetical protein
LGTAQLPAIDYSVVQDFGTVQLNDNATVEEHGWMADRRVDIVSIDAMALPGLDFFKLDVEGYEVSALRGALKTIKKHRPWIWVEYFITGVDPIKQVLDSIDNYEFFIMDYQNMLCVPKEKQGAITISADPA